jgi:hypothetical protein
MGQPVKNFVKLAAAAAAAFMASTGAMAATAAAPIDGTSVNSSTFASGAAISDSWTFTIPTLSTFDGLVSSTYTGASNNAIQNFAATLTGPGSYSQTWTYQSLAPTARIQLLFNSANLVDGAYSLAVSGIAGAAGSKYTVELNAAPVPEPHEWAMMLAGLGIVGWAARRRQVPSATPV